ncbi:MAG: DUF4878 domain-containing protein [Bacteroidales bacterium]|nr:DUF4878 domain-containing protein [Bacteroidales bacterium]
MKKLLSLLLCTVILSGLLVSCSGGGNTASDYASGYYEAMMKGDYKKAVKIMNPDKPEEAEMLVQKLEEIGKAGYAVKKYEVVSEELAEDGESAKVDFKVLVVNKAGEEPKETNETLKVRKVDGKWGKIEM